MNKLIMWSGGIDSTYILTKTLIESKLEEHVFVHHINIVNKEYRYPEETRAIRKLLPKLVEIKNFHYKESTRESLQMDMGYDMALVCYEAGAAMRHWKNRGFTIDEWGIGTNLEEGHWQERWDIIIQGTRAAYWEDPKIAPGFEEPPPFRLHDLVSKKEEMRYLSGLNLLQDCWYCRHPINGKVCNNCKTCLEVNKIHDGEH